MLNYTLPYYMKFITGLESFALNDLFNLLSSQFDPVKGFGFIDAEISATTVQSTLVFEVTDYLKRFDPITRQFTTEKQTIYEQANFEIFPSIKLLKSYSGGKRLQKIITCLSSLFTQNIAIDDVFIDISLFLNHLRKHHIAYNILGLTVNNFRPEIGLTGKFVANVSDLLVAQNIIDTYGSDVTDLSIEIKGNDIRCWQISSFGKVIIKAPNTFYLSSDSEIIHTLILESTNA